ncbi:transforming growth factor-beta-induced protein ig-h3-like [Dreissena polymorpha]|uniref:FAS1 domain-containing protein n=1 Tax=Dreissena polymorpha TaxID=45954 RepID=A0A9D4GN94_DREPO|nr:transforming growth factor-beta-induced protein ig-h3-like [Dreissena polymorpha]KAH3818698.1 hypothetical protein DPMN_120420 [Dreissena polymorpha]
MKLVVLLAFVGVCYAKSNANDAIWMELFSATIADAANGHKVNDDENIPQLAGKLGLNTLVALLEKTNLTDALAGEGPYTVFGPTDKAFAALPKKFVNYLLKNLKLLTKILTFHVADGKVLSSDLSDNQLVPSVEGSSIRINIYKNGTVITASGRQVTLPDQEASNGVIHEVSGVLFPPPGTISDVTAKCPVFSFLNKALEIAQLTSVLAGDGPFTIFAPCDRAFKRIPKKCLDHLLNDTALLTKVLEYHVVPAVGYSAGLSCGDELKTVEGGSVKITKAMGHVRVNHARVVYADASTTNGVMHVIDRVLFPRDSDGFCEDGALDYDDSSDEKNDVAEHLRFLNPF